MAFELAMPRLGWTMEKGSVVEWRKKDGERVQAGETLFVVESDKAVQEVEALDNGILYIPPESPALGQEVQVGTLLAYLLQPGESAPPCPATPLQPEPMRQVAEKRAAAQQPVPRGRCPSASPRARKRAVEKGVDLALVTGSSAGGRIVEEDVLAFAERRAAGGSAPDLSVPLAEVPAEVARPLATPSPAADAMISFGGRQTFDAERVAISARTAEVTLQSAVDATELVSLHTQLKDTFSAVEGYGVGYSALLAVVVARCLVEFPYMNVRLKEGCIRHLPEVNVGIAVNTEGGLIVPVIRNADRKSPKQLVFDLCEMMTRAREGKPLSDDPLRARLTITNLGMFGVDGFTSIISPSECTILGIGRIRPEPVVADGQIIVRQRMWLSLTFDHRLVDGAPAARFLQGITRYIETPYLLLA